MVDVVRDKQTVIDKMGVLSVLCNSLCVFVSVCAVSVGSQDALSEHILHASRQPRMSAFDRVFHV